MQNNVIDAQVSKLIEESKEMTERINQLEKEIEENQKKDVHDIKEILIQMKEQSDKITEFAETLLAFTTRKESIDKIIEKIKKILPI